MQPYIVPTTGMCKLSSCQDVETQHVCTQHHATQIQKQLSAKHFDLCFVAPIVLYPCGRCYICPWVLGLYFFIPMSQAEGLPDPWFQANKSTFFIRESILAQQQAISKTLASSDILTVWYKTNFIFCCENPYSPPSVSPPTAANRAGTSDWSRCPSPGRSSPLGILCSSICLRRQRDSERSTRAAMRRWMALQFPLETRRLEIDLLSQNNFVSRMKTCVTDTACLQKMQQSSLVTMYNSEIRTVKDSWNTLGKNKVPIQSLSSLAGPNNFLSWKRPPTSSVGRLVVRPAVAFATLM